MLRSLVPAVAFLGAVGFASIALTMDRGPAPAPSTTEAAPPPAASATPAGELVLDQDPAAAVFPRPAGVLTYLTGDGGYVAVDAGDPAANLEVVEGLEGSAPAVGVGGAYPSPDGRYVAQVRRDERGVWIDVRRGDAVVKTMQIAGPDDPELASAKSPAKAIDGVPLTVAWSPDSRFLAYGSITSEPFSLAVVRADRWSTLFRQVDGGYVGELAWAPDSSSLAISTYEIDRSDHTVLIYDPARLSVRHLIDGCAIVWAPDSAFLAVHREPAVAAGVWITSPDGETRIEVDDDELAFPITWTERVS